MTSRHETLKNKELVWNELLPDSFSGIRLPGSTLLSVQDKFGALTIQEYNAPGFSLLYTVAELHESFAYKIKTDFSGWWLQILLKGNQTEYTFSGLQWTLFKNQCIVLKSVSPEIITTFSKPGIYSSLNILLPASLLEELLPFFPQLHEQYLSEKQVHYLVSPAFWSGIEILDAVQSILNCTYEKQLRQYFYDTRIKDILFHLMLQVSNTNSFEKLLSQKEVEAIILAEQMITKDITAHIRIPELAKKIALNETTFKLAFKKVYGIGPYEYLLLLRMKKAVIWLQEGKSVKETAALTGYRPSDFTAAFIKHYGFKPSSVKKK